MIDTIYLDLFADSFLEFGIFRQIHLTWTRRGRDFYFRYFMHVIFRALDNIYLVFQAPKKADPKAGAKGGKTPAKKKEGGGGKAKKKVCTLVISHSYQACSAVFIDLIILLLFGVSWSSSVSHNFHDVCVCVDTSDRQC